MSDKEQHVPPTLRVVPTAGELADELGEESPIRDPGKHEIILGEVVEGLESLSATPSGAEVEKFEGPDETLVAGKNFVLEREAGAMVVKKVVGPTDVEE